MPRPPKVAVEELLQLAREVLARLGKAPITPAEVGAKWSPGGSMERVAPVLNPELLRGGLEGPALTPDALESVMTPFASRVSPRPVRSPDIKVPYLGGMSGTAPGRTLMPQFGVVEPPLDPTDVVPGAPVFDAAKAMTRVLNATIGRNAPTKVVPEAPIRVGAEKAPSPGRVTSPDDLRHQVAKYMLRSALKNPNKTPEQLVRATEPSLARWLEESTATLSKEPRAVGRRRQLVRRAEKERGVVEPHPDMVAAKEWLTKEGLLTPPVTEEVTEATVTGLARSPEEVFFAKEFGEPVGRYREMVGKIAEHLADPKLLTDRARTILNLHYDQGLSESQVAKALGISQPAVSQSLKKSRDLVKARLEKEKLTFERPEGPQGPPVYWPRTSSTKEPGGLLGTLNPPVQGPRSPAPKETGTLTESRSTERLGTPSSSFFRPGKEWRTQSERKELREYLNLLRSRPTLLNPSTGEPLFPIRTAEQVVRQRGKVPVASKTPSTEVPLPVRPSKPPVKKTYAEQVTEFQNTRPTRLIPDPAGDVVINGARYRRVPVVLQWVHDPKTKRLKKVIVDNPSSGT